MAEWESYSDRWVMRQERLAPDRWMICFIANPGYEEKYPNGWVYIYKEEWSSPTNDKRVEAVSFGPPSGRLELECIAHEMRKKYGAVHG